MPIALRYSFSLSLIHIFYLDGGDDGEILLPTRYVPEGCKPGAVLNVFLYLDNEERLIAVSSTHLAVYKRQLLNTAVCLI